MPINALVPVEGTPLGQKPRIDPVDFVRMIATTRIVLPAARVRLSAGRSVLSREAQILCMVAGANSIFYGEALLTTPNVTENEDDALFAALAPVERAEHLFIPKYSKKINPLFPVEQACLKLEQFLSGDNLSDRMARSSWDPPLRIT